MTIELNLDAEDEKPKPKRKPKQAAPAKSETVFLADMDTHRIAEEFVDFRKKNRTLIIPVGFPQAGKSLLLSSLLYYAKSGEEVPFTTNILTEFPYNKGHVAADQMVQYFADGEIYEATSKGTLDLIGINITPRRDGYPPMKLAFLDVAGEDVKNIKTSEGSDFTEKLNAVFNGIETDDSNLVFVLVTPYEPARNDNESLKSAHNREDALHIDFLNHLEVNKPHLKRNCQFFVIVSQWDRNPDPNADVESFIRENRPSVYSYVKSSRVFWGSYSIGKLLESTVDGVRLQTIVRRNQDYPSKFWRMLYLICTGRDYEHKSWWQKLFQ